VPHADTVSAVRQGAPSPPTRGRTRNGVFQEISFSVRRGEFVLAPAAVAYSYLPLPTIYAVYFLVLV